MGLLLALLAAPALAQVTVTDAWVRGTVPGQKGTGAYMQLTSAADMTLIGVASPAAKVAEIHEMAQDGNMMRMRAVDQLALPAGKAVALKPGGYHVMLMDLAHPLKEGDVVSGDADVRRQGGQEGHAGNQGAGPRAYRGNARSKTLTTEPVPHLH
jgi:copper(I)-binding protein